jgi:hypothetical protein
LSHEMRTDYWRSGNTARAICAHNLAAVHRPCIRRTQVETVSSWNGNIDSSYA